MQVVWFAPTILLQECHFVKVQTILRIGSYTFGDQEVQPLGFVHGLVLQIVNPKLIVYAFTLFSAFLATTIKTFSGLLLVVLFLTLVAFCAASTWALFGTAIKSYLRNPALTRAINILLSLSLVYAAISLTGTESSSRRSSIFAMELDVPARSLRERQILSTKCESEGRSSKLRSILQLRREATPNDYFSRQRGMRSGIRSSPNSEHNLFNRE